MQPVRDELLDEKGRLKTPWRRMLGSLLGMGTTVLRERRGELDRAFADLGATAVLAGPGAAHWRCDPIPLLMQEGEFLELADRLRQRASLLEAVLADVYGPRRLLAEGVLPAGLVYPAPRYVAECRGIAVPRHITLYAADLARGPDGAWQVVADRTAEPAGLAYVLENRRVMARVLPELFREFDVAETRPFFDAWADHLREEGRALADPAGLALLSPGQKDPRWFEHVMLARTLGLALVEDGDLTVRDEALWVKTLRGLQPLHVLLRRQDGGRIDPLELSGSGGAPGLLHVLRCGGIRVLNSPGAGYAETPALAGYLDAVARAMLGEKLALPSAPTHWLGAADAELVDADRLRGTILADALDHTAPARVFDSLDAAGRAAAVADARAHPARFAVITPPAASNAPCVGDGETLDPRGIILRLYLVARGDGWVALPGGLARVLGPGEVPGGRLPAEALSKDVWVLRDEGDIVGGSGNLTVPALPIRRMAGDLPSRVADNFFWFGRYLERLDMAARLARALLSRLGRAAPLPHEVGEISVLCACLSEAGIINAEHAHASGQAILIGLLHAALTREAGAVANMSGRIQGLCDGLRDRLSGEMYDSTVHGLRSLKGARLALHRIGRADSGMLLDLCSRILAFSATVAGYAAENMVRGGGRLFLDLGRRIERAQSVASQLRHALDQPPPRIEAGLALALELCDSTITYRGRYLNVLQPAPVLDLILSDDGNPRGLAYQLAQARDLLATLGGQETSITAMLDPLMDETRQIVTDLLAASDQAGAAAAMAPRLHAIEDQCAAVSDAVTRRYFALLPMRATRDMVPA